MVNFLKSSYHGKFNMVDQVYQFWIWWKIQYSRLSIHIYGEQGSLCDHTFYPHKIPKKPSHIRKQAQNVNASTPTITSIFNKMTKQSITVPYLGMVSIIILFGVVIYILVLPILIHAMLWHTSPYWSRCKADNDFYLIPIVIFVLYFPFFPPFSSLCLTRI